MKYELNLKDFKKKTCCPLGSHFRGTAPDGSTLSFTNCYMETESGPFFGISGEFHFSRCDESRWEDGILKMKMCGIRIVSTYIFWNHHEEEEGIFDFSVSKDLRKFVELCGKHQMYVILRIGPFVHGEVRNGGLPDWLYGKPFEVRKLNEGFLRCTRRLYSEIAGQIRGLLYKDGGPVIAAQIDNEYMHASAMWEITTGISNEWIFRGDDREAYMLALRDLAKECGIDTPFYTCTGWGGAITPDEMLPLWGGYAYRPWLFYTEGRGEHPVTEEYIYQDFHNNEAVVTSDFKPAYLPEDRPYACCEMGGGMTCTYNYRFVLPFQSVDAMANIKLASGCNFLGYYVFHGGSNPKGKHGMFLNEAQAPKISYDYQAAIGEFGQIRESYRRLKTIHLFCRTFENTLCDMQTMLPEGASLIDPKDTETLRFAVRTGGKSGFLFLNNFQDHLEMKPKKDESVTLHLNGEDLTFPPISLAPGENCILPFHMDLAGIDLVCATAQPVTRIASAGKDCKAGNSGTSGESFDSFFDTCIFLKPDGMDPVFRFEEGVVTNPVSRFEEEAVTDQGGSVYRCTPGKAAELFRVSKGAAQITILCLDRTLAGQMYPLSDGTLLFSECAVLEDETGIRLETISPENTVLTWPKEHRIPLHAEKLHKLPAGVSCPEQLRGLSDIFDVWKIKTDRKEIPVTVTQTAYSKYEFSFPEDLMGSLEENLKDELNGGQNGRSGSRLKDVLLQIDYTGDIGSAFIDGDMIHDNFCNGDTWEIGLRTFAGRLKNSPLTISIAPLREGVNVNTESAMAARMESADQYIAGLKEVRVYPVYEIKIS